MLHVYCTSNKTMHTSLQRPRPFVICLFIYQVMTLTTNSIKARKGLNYVDHERSCFLRTVKTFLLLLLTSNTAAVALLEAYSDSIVLDKMQIEISKHLQCAAQVFGCIGAAAVWLNCHEFVSDTILSAVMVFGLLLLLAVFVSHT